MCNVYRNGWARNFTAHPCHSVSFQCYNDTIRLQRHSYKTGFFIPPKYVYKIISFVKRLRSFACLPLLYLPFYSLLKQQSFCGYVIFIATDEHGITRHVRAVPCCSVAITTPCVSNATATKQGFTLLQSIPVNVFRSQNACVHSHTYLYCFFRFIRC